jgi:hypothetical protein
VIDPGWAGGEGEEETHDLDDFRHASCIDAPAAIDRPKLDGWICDRRGFAGEIEA